MTESCLERAQSSEVMKTPTLEHTNQRIGLVNGVSRACASREVFIGTIISTANPLSKFIQKTTATSISASQFTPRPTLSTIVTTSAFVATTLFTSPSVPTSTPSGATQATEPIRHSTLSSQATGGIADVATVLGLATVAGVLWCFMRRRQKARNDTITTVERQEQQTEQRMNLQAEQQEHDTYPEDIKETYQHQRPIQKSPGDDPTAQPTSPTSNRLSELDSIRPVSELESIETNHERWSAAHARQAASPTMPNVVEIGDGRPSPLLTNEPVLVGDEVRVSKATDGGDDAIDK